MLLAFRSTLTRVATGDYFLILSATVLKQSLCYISTNFPGRLLFRNSGKLKILKIVANSEP